MSTYTWTIANGTGDWGVSSDWSPVAVPNDSTAVVNLTATAVPAYTVLVGAGETEVVNTITLNASGATLEVAGTLNFAGAAAGMTYGLGTLKVDSGGVIGGAGGVGQFEIPGVSFVNNGTILGSGGSNTSLVIYSGLTNNGTLLANNGNVLIAGASGITNLSAGTLTGGTYESQGFIPLGATTAPVNLLAFGFNSAATITTDAATIILDGAASAIQTSNSGAYTTLEQQLQTIASTGTLQVLDGRGYTTTKSIVDNGAFFFQGGTLSTGGLTIGSTGTLNGYGTVLGAVTIANGGAVIASGGSGAPMALKDVISGTGALDVLSGSTLIVSGGSVGTIAIGTGGTLYDTGALAVSGTISGSGVLEITPGATLEAGGAISQGVSFSGAYSTLKLDSPGQFTGKLTGFGAGDLLVLGGVSANSATVVNGSTLAVMSGGSTVDTIALNGNYAGATFSAQTLGGNTVIQSVAGAPAHDGMPINLVSFTDNASLSSTVEQEIVNDLSAAAAEWGQYIYGLAPLRVSLTIATTGSFGGELAQGSPGGYIANGQTIDGHKIYEPDSLYALTTGTYSSFSTDVAITVFATPDNLANFYINPNPSVPGAVPGDKYDLVSVLAHEFGHGLGINGFVNVLSPQATPISSGIADPLVAAAAASPYDANLQETVVNTSTVTGAYFVGAAAEAAYGALLGTNTPTAVPLTLQPSDQENFYHLANASSDPLGTDLMNGVGIGTGMSVTVSALDVAIMQDIGAPVVCYGRGTRIKTVRGEVPVEELRTGEDVITADGETLSIVWIGRRRVDCRRHPQPRNALPVRIRAHAFAPDAPRRDLIVSPRHAIYFEGSLIPARLLINGTTVEQLDVATVDYFHVELPRHALLLAEGLAAESYLDCGDRNLFANAGGNTVLFPDFGTRMWDAAACFELCLVGPEVEAVRGHLAARAGVITRESAGSCLPQVACA